MITIALCQRILGNTEKESTPTRSPNTTMDQPKSVLQRKSATAQANWQITAYAIAPVTPTPTALPPLSIDWNRLHQISDHDPEFELELLQLFAEDIEHHLTQLEAAIATQDFFALEQQAHHIKGSSANVGFRPMHVAASILEIQARRHQLDDLTPQVDLLQQTLKTLQMFLAVR